MRSERVKKHVTEIDFKSTSYYDVKNNIKKFLKSVLSQLGLKSGRDYLVTKNYLKIRHIKTVIGQILITLKEVFPMFNYYWKTPRILVWF